MEMAKQQRIKNKMTWDPYSFNDDEFEVCEILLNFPQLIAREKDNRDSHFQLSCRGKRTRYEIGCSSSTPSLPSPLLGPHYYRNGNTSATLHPSSLSKPDANRKKMDLLENTIRVTENIRKLKQETPKSRGHCELLKHTISILKRMEIEVSSCVKQKELNLNSSPETITGPIELSSQAPVQEGKEEKEEKKGEDADGVLEQAEASGSGTLVNCSTSQETNEVKQKELNLNSSPETITGPKELPSQAPVQEGKEEKEEDADGVLEQAEASGSGTSVSCSSQETNEVKGLSDISVRVTVLPDLNLSMESSLGMDFVDPDDQNEEAIAVMKFPLL